jgi:hypothetical protein
VDVVIDLIIIIAAVPDDAKVFHLRRIARTTDGQKLLSDSLMVVAGARTAEARRLHFC